MNAGLFSSAPGVSCEDAEITGPRFMLARWLLVAR
jgi:hypothetical protein